MTQELIYSDFAELIIEHRLNGTIENCFAWLDGLGDVTKAEKQHILDNYKDNIEMIRACIKVLQWFTIENYDEDIARVNKYSLNVEDDERDVADLG
jgi:hypothetical protein